MHRHHSLYTHMYKVPDGRRFPSFLLCAAAFIEFVDVRDAEDAVKKMDGFKGWVSQEGAASTHINCCIHPPLPGSCCKPSTRIKESELPTTPGIV